MLNKKILYLNKCCFFVVTPQKYIRKWCFSYLSWHYLGYDLSCVLLFTPEQKHINVSLTKRMNNNNWWFWRARSCLDWAITIPCPVAICNVTDVGYYWRAALQSKPSSLTWVFLPPLTRPGRRGVAKSDKTPAPTLDPLIQFITVPLFAKYFDWR